MYKLITSSRHIFLLSTEKLIRRVTIRNFRNNLRIKNRVAGDEMFLV